MPLSRFRLIDLLRAEDGRYDGKVATYDIEQSGLGYLFAFADSQQATTFGGVIEAFARSHAVTTCCSAEIIDGVASGQYLIAYNVLGSYALARADKDPNIAVVAPSDYTLVLSRAALIPKRAANPGDAGALIDFLLSDEGRRALAAEHLVLDPSEMRDQGLLGSEDGNHQPAADFAVADAAWSALTSNAARISSRCGMRRFTKTEIRSINHHPASALDSNLLVLKG